MGKSINITQFRSTFTAFSFKRFHTVNILTQMLEMRDVATAS